MALRKCVPVSNATPVNGQSLTFSKRENGKASAAELVKNHNEADVDLDLREVYFLIFHFLSAGPFQRTCGQLWNELLECQLLPRRYHAWYSRSGIASGDENDDGISFPLNYSELVGRHLHVGKDHLIKLLKQLILDATPSDGCTLSRNSCSAATVPTLLGTGSFSLVASDHVSKGNNDMHPPSYLRWPHKLADQVRGLGLREIGGGFTRHQRAPSTHAACYVIAKPSTMVQKMQNIKRVRGHRNAVYCAIFDRSGRYVVTGSDDRLVKIWSMETAYCLVSCRGHEGDITDLAVSSNNALVASASNDCTIRVWHMPDGLPISVLRGHTGAVTAIQFSPRPGALYLLLSSSDDGTCRIWDARNPLISPRIYVPKPPDSVAGRIHVPASTNAQQSHQIFCCAFSSSGTVFVTGSSDTFARVWNVCKPVTENLGKPNHEMDVLAGHENDVNYVQFSGCSVAARASTSDASKEDGSQRFRNSWSNYDNIVTCSRDGSAIIWIPRSRRSHGKAGRWIRAYHLKVPPPPMPPQPPRGGPRQRVVPTSRGVNMIAWSLDNRFVLAAIMDCRICVWNAVDGSLVHSLTGHTNSTYVLDVHPFNPRIAMSAGYDGKTIVWDIWEGAPISTYEIGPFKLVDGKFSPDGTSIILSDDVGQLYIINTGQGESQKDAKFDQFFLGDYRPLIHDTHGNVLDQETQLAPHQRNMQDLLCDSGMIPYPEPYQTLYQKRRLGTLGFEWRPSSLRLAVGVDFSLDPEYQMLPIVDLDTLINPMPEFVDVVDWEPDVDMYNDDNDSEYHLTEDYSSGGDQVSLNSDLGEPECSSEDVEVEESHRDGHRRSKRGKQKVEVEIMTSSGRRVKRKNVDGVHDSLIRKNRRKLQNGRKASRKKSPSKSRPRRAAARNALHLFSRITGTSTNEDLDAYDANSFESGSTLPDSSFSCEESDASLQEECYENSKGKERLHDCSLLLEQNDEFPRPPSYTPSKTRLILKLPNRDLSRKISGSCHDDNGYSVAGPSNGVAQKLSGSDRTSDNLEYGKNDGDVKERNNLEHPTLLGRHLVFLGGSKDGSSTWGGVKARSSKKFKMGEQIPAAVVPGPSVAVEQNPRTENVVNGQTAIGNHDGTQFPVQPGIPKMEADLEEITIKEESSGNLLPAQSERAEEMDKGMGSWSKSDADADVDESSKQVHSDSNEVPLSISDTKEKESGTEVRKKLRIKPINLSKDQDSSGSPNLQNLTDNTSGGIVECEKLDMEKLSLRNSCNVRDIYTEDNCSNGSPKSLDQVNGGLPMFNMEDSDTSDTNERMFTAFYSRSRRSKRYNPEVGGSSMEASTSKTVKSDVGKEDEIPLEAIRRARSIRIRSSTHDLSNVGRNFTCTPPEVPSLDRGMTCRIKGENLEDWESGSKNSTRSRSTRSKKGTNYIRHVGTTPRESTQTVKTSWLMLSAHEEGSRYIPQYGDEVVYLREGHQGYLTHMRARNSGPWETIHGIRAVEFCRLERLEYSNHAGSGDSCCKMTLKFIDPASLALGKLFTLTLPEVTCFPDFLVEKSRYDASIARNWTARDKCTVWWRNEGEENGNWWEGRIMHVNEPKSAEFPDSPWERYAVKYKSDPTETHHHSPWELYDTHATGWDQPHIDDDARDILLSAIAKLEQSAGKHRDHYGVGKLNDITQKTNFINRFPVPISLEVIKARLENNYYRRVDAVKHDVEVLLSNAKSYFGKNAEQTMKMKRLSDWFAKTLSSL